MDIIEFFQELLNPRSILHYGGLVLLLIVIFAENGLIIGFFLPGDSLIFLSGLICATQPELLSVDITLLTTSMFLAAVAGSFFGYYFGWKVGPAAFNRKDSWFFKQKYVDMTRDFYAKHGGKTLIIGRFLPIIRTFAPIFAGVIKVDIKIFTLFNLIGGALWIGVLSLTGFYLGSRFPIIEEYLGYIILGFILITTFIILKTYFSQRRKSRLAEEEKADLNTK